MLVQVDSTRITMKYGDVAAPQNGGDDGRMAACRKEGHGTSTRPAMALTRVEQKAGDPRWLALIEHDAAFGDFAFVTARPVQFDDDFRIGPGARPHHQEVVGPRQGVQSFGKDIVVILHGAA